MGYKYKCNIRKKNDLKRAISFNIQRFKEVKVSSVIIAEVLRKGSIMMNSKTKEP